jgi:hypothetical protein
MTLMSTNEHLPHTEATDNRDSIATESTLIATFFGEKGRLGSLMAWAERTYGGHEGMQLATLEGGDRHIYHTTSEAGESILLEQVQLPGVVALDTDAIQLILNEGGAASEAWPSLLKRLQANNLREVLGRLHEDDAFWGYSLVYQAVLSEGYSLQDGIETLGWVARSPAMREQTPVPLASTALQEEEQTLGRLWLMDIPYEGKGLDAATVYAMLVVGQDDENRQKNSDKLLNQYFLGRTGVLLLPDLVAHKSYYYVRQYHDPPFVKEYKKYVRELRNQSSEVLSRQMRHPLPKDESFHLLKTRYAKLLKYTSILRDLQLSMEEQHANYEQVRQVGVAEILNYHKEHIDNASDFLQHLIDMGDNALEKTRTVIEFVQIDIEHTEERRERSVTLLLAIVGAAVAIPELLPAQTICDFFGWQCKELSGGSVLFPVGIQFVLIIGLTVALFYGVCWWFEKWQRK